MSEWNSLWYHVNTTLVLVDWVWSRCFTPLRRIFYCGEGTGHLLFGVVKLVLTLPRPLVTYEKV